MIIDYSIKQIIGSGQTRALRACYLQAKRVLMRFLDDSIYKYSTCALSGNLIYSRKAICRFRDDYNNNYYAPLYIMYQRGSRKSIPDDRDVESWTTRKGRQSGIWKERATAARRRWKWRPIKHPQSAAITLYRARDLCCHAASRGDPALLRRTGDVLYAPTARRLARTRTHALQPPHNILYSPSPPLPRADFAKFNEFNTRLAIINPRFN